MEFKRVDYSNIKELVKLAYDIWHEYWVCILKQEQIDYMVEKFQSENAIFNQMKNENYTYFFINENNCNIGYFGVQKREDYLFLSKLYLNKNSRHKGIGKIAFKKIIEIALEFNYEKIRLAVNKYNQNTINAYLKYGFKTIESALTDIGEGFYMDDYIMEYDITSRTV